jgi:hypothetical protein
LRGEGAVEARRTGLFSVGRTPVHEWRSHGPAPAGWKLPGGGEEEQCALRSAATRSSWGLTGSWVWPSGVPGVDEPGVGVLDPELSGTGEKQNGLEYLSRPLDFRSKGVGVSVHIIDVDEQAGTTQMARYSSRPEPVENGSKFVFLSFKKCCNKYIYCLDTYSCKT